MLRHFRGVPHLEQLLVRAAIRMLLIMGGFEGWDGWETCHEKRAAEIVLEFAGVKRRDSRRVRRHAPGAGRH